MNKEELIEKFTKYVKTFNLLDNAIRRKYYHSIRVMDYSIELAKNLKLKKSDIELGMVIGLLHDYGRFTQWSTYKTYKDIESIDHGDFGVEILTNDEISKYYNNKENYELIRTAIKYHNKLEISNELNERNILFSKLIRDADKLDIFYIFSINKELFIEDNNNITKEVEETFYSNKPISYKILKNDSDKILLDLAFVYDLNFDCSLKILKENNMIEKMFENIENKNKYRKYFDYIKNYIDERIDKLC